MEFQALKSHFRACKDFLLHTVYYCEKCVFVSIKRKNEKCDIKAYLYKTVCYEGGKFHFANVLILFWQME